MNKINCTRCGKDNNRMATYCSGCGFKLPKPASESEATFVPLTSAHRSSTKKKIISAVVASIAFVLSFVGVQYLFFKQPSFDQVLVDMASELNKSCPIIIDQDTRLDHVLALPNNIFQYNYTMVNLEKAEIDTDELRNYLEPNIINNLRTNAEMQPFRTNKTTLAYSYNDKNGVFVLKLTIGPDLYE